MIEITPVAVAAIVAPSYGLHHESGPDDRVRESLQSYRVEEHLKRVTARGPSAAGD